ncbi:MAG TPA: hypothetical protein VLD65_01190 [Anaerolineales bacterium]|nr:hypothetical protein [Anaerolineales bacterium]
MLEQAILLKLATQNLSESTTSHLRQEYQAYQRLFQAQPMMEQQYLNSQAAALAGAIVTGTSPLHFSLPEHVVCLPIMDCSGIDTEIPTNARQYRLGSFIDWLTHPNLSSALSQRLIEMEKSVNPAVAAAAGLLRYAVAVHLIYHLVPAGKTVVYADTEDDDVPNQPVRGFFLPQLVAFDDQNRLLLADEEEAIAQINTLRHFLNSLNSAVSLAPYMVVDEDYQYKHYGILGQLVNQGRALASYQVELICQTINLRSAAHRLDRGFSLSIPYFDDKSLAIEQYDFDVIPKGRVMFVPAFVVLAVRAEGLRIAQNVSLNHSTRKHLLQELIILEKAFIR